MCVLHYVVGSMVVWSLSVTAIAIVRIGVNGRVSQFYHLCCQFTFIPKWLFYLPPNSTVAPICPGSCREVLLVADAPTENHSQMAPTHPTSDESALSFSKAFSRPSFPRFSVPPTQGGAFQVHQGGACQVDQGGATQRQDLLRLWFANIHAPQWGPHMN